MFSARASSFFARLDHQVALASAVSTATFLLQWNLHQEDRGQQQYTKYQQKLSQQHLTFCDAEQKKNPDFSPHMANFPSNSPVLGNITTGGPNDDGGGAGGGGQPQELDNTSMFHGQCLLRQLHRPKLPYPAWDYNWDHRETKATTQEALSGQSQFAKSKSLGKTRHILLVRHGQYDERYKEDRRRKLTPLGRHQAELTGQRIALFARGGMQGGPHLAHHKKDNVLGSGPLYIKCIHVSDMERAKETAQIIHSHLPHVKMNDPDPLLNEALPCPMIPIRPDVRAVREIDANHSRVEAAFQKYFHRDDPNDDNNNNSDSTAPVDSNTPDIDTPHVPEQDSSHHHPLDPNAHQYNPQHEFEILVGHGNVIRFFFCRALQLPPEAWLRISAFNCSITYLMIYPNGYVSCRMMGDVGHLGYDNTSFSGSHGYNW